MNNRIQSAISVCEIKVKQLAAEKVVNLGKQLDIQFDEFVKFQELKSVASIDGTLTLDEAQTVYGYLGNTPEHFNRQPVAVKVVLTQLLAELLKRRIARG